VTLGEYLRISRKRWILVVATTLLGVLVALVLSLLATPKYVATAQLFVTTPAAYDIADTYQGNLFSQQRVASYTKLLTDESLAQQTVDRLHLNVTAKELAKHIKAKAIPETVLIDVNVDDSSPERAAEIANTLSDEFATMVASLEKPDAPFRMPVIRVVVAQPASIPQYRVSPRKKLNLLLGAIIGAIAGFGAALLRERIDKSVSDRGEVENLTGARVLATLPPGDKASPAAVIDFDGSSTDIAEAYRCLGATVADLDDNLPRVMVVTSPGAVDEKTAVAVNLAQALAEANHTVCLVDGDLRTRALSQQFDKEGAEGLSSVLRDGLRVPDIIQPVGFGGLTFLSAGPAAANPSELLAPSGLVGVIDNLRAMFDQVIIDTPPLPQFADAVLVARRADGAVLVIRQDETNRDELARAANLLSDGNATLLGTVMMAARRRPIIMRRKSKRAKVTQNDTNAGKGKSDAMTTNRRAANDDDAGRHSLDQAAVFSRTGNGQ
jgi:capsular exopolysaccharide synthesis family protein